MTTMTHTNFPQWVDSDHIDIRHDGDVFFLVETFDTSTGRTSWSIRDRPLRTNLSAAPRLHGWCGETNNRSRTARGLVRVVGQTRDRARARIARVEGEDLTAALEACGYPDLATVSS